MPDTTPHVYTAIANVQGAIAKIGIAKGRKNAQQGYAFRGIDDVYGALAPLFAQHGLVIIPRVLARTCTERQTQRGGVLFYTCVDVEYTIASAQDGSTVTARICGEAMDSADKSTNKAMSAAYKYLCLQTFCIPTEGDNDADATTHEVAPASPAPAQKLFNLEAALAKIAAAKDADDLKQIGRDVWKSAPERFREHIKAAGDKRRLELATE